MSDMERGCQALQQAMNYKAIKATLSTSWQAKPFMVSLSIEFDASTFKTRVRKGMIVADAKYHVLAARQS